MITELPIMLLSVMLLIQWLLSRKQILDETSSLFQETKEQHGIPFLFFTHLIEMSLIQYL